MGRRYRTDRPGQIGRLRILIVVLNSSPAARAAGQMAGCDGRRRRAGGASATSGSRRLRGARGADVWGAGEQRLGAARLPVRAGAEEIRRLLPLCEAQSTAR